MNSTKVEVRLFAYLRDGRAHRLYMDVKTVRQVLEELKIADEDAYIVLINGRDATRESPVSPGDVVSIFPQVGGG